MLYYSTVFGLGGSKRHMKSRVRRIWPNVMFVETRFLNHDQNNIVIRQGTTITFP